MLDEYRQQYLNAKNKGQLRPRIFLSQANNSGEYLKKTKGRFGQGFYAVGSTIDRNLQNVPQSYQHSTDPELLLDPDTFATGYNSDAKRHLMLVMLVLGMTSKNPSATVQTLSIHPVRICPLLIHQLHHISCLRILFQSHWLLLSQEKLMQNRARLHIQ